ncbi:nucleolar complex protein 4 homolog [Leguminivora glycinivorella]|uniref:nucleolar complex protein 4 homolog n=1 Tax=Leguminivora glycinivorella TaxID=1035111 RepID=UPI00200E35A5|nr:nucleolar complex protein 4 homolog [Leguminivora glycinivorella]
MRPALIYTFNSRPQKPRKVPNELFAKAELILESKKNANVLCEVLEMFNKEEKNYTPLLLTVELIFTTLLKRGEMFETGKGTGPDGGDPGLIHCRWLRENYQLAFKRVLACMSRGEDSSRKQALASCLKLMMVEGENPTLSKHGVICFPDWRLQSVFDVILDAKQSQSMFIKYLECFTDYRDFQQNALNVLADLKYSKAPSEIYVQNYLELFEMIMRPGLNQKERPKQPEKYYDKKIYPEDRYYIKRDSLVSDIFDPAICKKSINRCWSFCMQWPLRANETNHRRALVVLVDRIMPYLTKPVLATDFLCDSLDCGSAISMIALRGIMELVTEHDIDFPDIYDRLYGMFEPDMFATRSKRRLIHIADVFLSSTRVPETMIASFAKRLARLALVASPEDAQELLRLIANMVHRHPGLKRMLKNDQPAILPQDPFEMEESRANATNAIQSSLWEVAALKQHFTPEVCASAAKVLALADSGAKPPDLPPSFSDEIQFTGELKKRFKTIEMNFVYVPPTRYWDKEDWKINTFWHLIPDFK